jgi:hypothetical protein
MLNISEKTTAKNKLYSTLVSWLLLLILASSCNYTKKEPVDTSNPNTTKNDSEVSSNDRMNIFADSNFTFIELDSLTEDMLIDKSERDLKYINSVKRFKTEHFTFFKFKGVENTFFAEHYFLVARQKLIGEIKPIIVHQSGDFNYYHSELYTLDKNYNKIDSATVSYSGFDTGGDEPYDYISIGQSTFDGDLITTTSLEYKRFSIDSLVTIDSVIATKKIESDGKIKIIKTERFDTTNKL